jgi:hypothetical protein
LQYLFIQYHSLTHSLSHSSLYSLLPPNNDILRSFNSTLPSNMSSNKMIKTMYKSFYKLAIKYDKSVAAKSLLYRLPSSLPHSLTTTTKGSTSVTSSDSIFRSASQIHFNAMIDKALGPNRVFFPTTRLTHSLKSIIQKEFRNRKSKISLTSRLDVGFSLLRQLSTLWVNYEQEMNYKVAVDDLLAKHHAATTTTTTGNGSGSDDKSVNVSVSECTSGNSTSKEKKLKKKLKKESKLDVTTAPATVQEGVVLAAHPMVHGDLHRALVLVVEHTEKFSYGVILNKAETQHTVRSGVSGVRLDGFYDAFGVRWR